jgi:glycogen phosphorylase
MSRTTKNGGLRARNEDAESCRDISAPLPAEPVTSPALLTQEVRIDESPTKVGTPRDTATIEMAEEAGEENFCLFGLTAQQVAGSRGWYRPHWHYENEPEIRGALDLIFGDHFSQDEPGIFAPTRQTLLDRGDYFMHLAGLTAYTQAQQQLGEMYSDEEAWSRAAIINIACSGKFSSDRTIAEYAAEIWNVQPCPVA